MLKNQLNTKKGFTIIEVVLVLAIAGLIFLMVFIALPALQRSQKDTQRKNDVGRVVQALQSFQGNNRGKLPSNMEGAEKSVDGAENFDSNIKISSPWKYFYHRYLLTESNDDFRDPKGTPYKLKIVDGVGSGSNDLANTFNEQAYEMVINTKAKCDGEQIKDAGGDRNFTVRYRGEGGSVICQGA